MAILYLLPQLIQIPPSRAKKSSLYWKPSRPEVKKGFVTEVTGPSELSIAIQEKKERYENLNRNLQPYIIVVGNNIFEVTEAYIIIGNNIKYKLKSFLEAVDTCFKIFFATDAHYPEECLDVWRFIEIAFYQMKQEKKKVLSQAVKHLLSDLAIRTESL